MTRVVMPFPATPSQRASHILSYTYVMGIFYGNCSLWGGGYACPPPPSKDRSSPAQNAYNKHWPGPGHTPSPRASPPPRSQLLKTAIGRLNGWTFRVFSYTHVRQYLPTVLVKLANNYETREILVFHEDVFITDLQCAMMRPEML
jgi:hypothetical protein